MTTSVLEWLLRKLESISLEESSIFVKFYMVYGFGETKKSGKSKW